MNKLYCLIGPSGAGKDTLKKASGLPYVVSYRTRKKRPWEVDGDDGLFITHEAFKKIEPHMIAKTEYNGEFYGITSDQLKGLKTSNMIYVIDMKGYNFLQKKVKDMKLDFKLVSIFIDVNPEQIEERLIKQGRSEEEIKKRLQLIPRELEDKTKCDYIIENKTTLDDAIRQLHDIIMK